MPSATLHSLPYIAIKNSPALCKRSYWCTPQGERTPEEKEEFKRTLKVINMLYLGARVQVLLDFSYINRFWTQFEAWVN